MIYLKTMQAFTRMKVRNGKVITSITSLPHYHNLILGFYEGLVEKMHCKTLIQDKYYSD